MAEIARPVDRARPHRRVEGREQQPDHGGVHTPQRRLHARLPTQPVPERQHADEQQEGGKVDRHQAEHSRRPRHSVPGPHCRAEIGREGEQRPRHRLRRAVAGQKAAVADPAGRDHRLLQQRQHDMTASEDQGARAIEAGQKIERSGCATRRSHRAGRNRRSARNADESAMDRRVERLRPKSSRARPGPPPAAAGTSKPSERAH